MHSNSARVSSAVRKVLRFPADNLRVGLDQSVKDLNAKRDETVKVKEESGRAAKYFSNLVRNSLYQQNSVSAIDLDAPPPGAH